MFQVFLGGRNDVSTVFTSMRPKIWIKGCHWVISQRRRSRVSGENRNKNWTSFQNWRQESNTGQRGFQEAAGDAERRALALYCLWKLCLLYVLRLWFSEKLPTLATFHKAFRFLPNSCRRTLAGHQPKASIQIKTVLAIWQIWSCFAKKKKKGKYCQVRCLPQNTATKKCSHHIYI